MNGRRLSFLSSIAILLIIPSALLARERTETVQIREARLRSTPEFFGTLSGTLKYGDSVTVKERRNQWTLVVDPATGTEGWIDASALTTAKLQITSGESAAEVTASSGEMALSTKGFNSQVESEFKERNTAIDFAPVDAMEQILVSDEQIAAFISEGDLTPQGGAE